ncbi:hypothetical protein [Chengkuizengella marina]|uniref:hypothetical protein n=1 Tax=Chengkuizengella marina TaxID=2507566 RepID=UPI00191C123E|nr:hypothetical protein [Chengkuizengella marina]
MEIKGNVVEEYMSGNTKMIFCDDAYVNKTKEEELEILNRFYQAVWKCAHTLVEKEDV